jgi:hypothetical protein
MVHSFIDISLPFFTSHRHCEERFEGLRKAKSVRVSPIGNERRGNLLALHNRQEVFKILMKITSLQPQSREIASRIQQRLAFFAFRSLILRLAMTNESGGLGLRQSGLTQGLSNLTSDYGSKGLQPLVMLTQVMKGGV